jgi:hypothetical protein
VQWLGAAGGDADRPRLVTWEDVVMPLVLFFPEVLWCEAQCFDQAQVALTEVAVEGGFRTPDGRTVTAAFFLDPAERRRLQDLIAAAAHRLFAAVRSDHRVERAVECR